MMPDYDPNSVKLNYLKKQKALAKSKPEKPIEGIEEDIAEDITANKKIGNTEYHFAFYNSDNGSELCLVSNSKNEVLVLQKDGKGWQLLQSAKGAVLKRGKELAEHAEALYQLQNKRPEKY